MALEEIQHINKYVDSAKALRYVWLTWRLIGIYPPKSRPAKLLYAGYRTIIIVLFFICLPITLLVQLLFIESLEELIVNLSVSTSFVNSTCKYFVILACRDLLLNVQVSLKQLDTRCNAYPEDREQIWQVVRLCKYLCATYVFFYNFVGCGYGYVGYTNHRLMQSGWFPRFFSHDDEANYQFAFWYQFIAQVFAVFQNANNDMYSPCLLAIMIAHMRALNARIMRIGWDSKQVAAVHQAELLNCIEDHKQLLSYFDCIRKPISRTIALQFLIMAFVLCLNAINFMLFDHDWKQSLFTATYLFAILIEAFPCCWFVNELMREYNLLTTAIYSCNWYAQDQHFRKTLIIFMQRSQKQIVLMAGGLAPVTLQTFISVIRFSFSMFTILSQIDV